MFVHDLIQRLREVPPDAELFGYVGGNGITIKAERGSIPEGVPGIVVLTVPSAAPQAGGPVQ